MPKKHKVIYGDAGDNDINGGKGNDKLVGLGGDDIINGGAGNDTIWGDAYGTGSGKGSHGHGSKGPGKGSKGSGSGKASKGPGTGSKASGSGSGSVEDGNDYLDGGAGNDKIFAGGGDDHVTHIEAENTKSKDDYRGGEGFDTLHLILTDEEYADPKVAAEIASFEDFLLAFEPGEEGGKFHFKELGIKVDGFEALDFVAPDPDPDPDPDPSLNDVLLLEFDRSAGILGIDEELADIFADDVVGGTNIYIEDVGFIEGVVLSYTQPDDATIRFYGFGLDGNGAWESDVILDYVLTTSPFPYLPENDQFTYEITYMGVTIYETVDVAFIWE